MVKLRFLLMAVLMLAASTQMYAGWRVVVDKNCIKIVSSNLAAQKLIEEQHNAWLDTIAAKQQKVGTLFGQHGHDEGTLQAVDAEHLRLRYGEPVL